MQLEILYKNQQVKLYHQKYRQLKNYFLLHNLGLLWFPIPVQKNMLLFHYGAYILYHEGGVKLLQGTRIFTGSSS